MHMRQLVTTLATGLTLFFLFSPSASAQETGSITGTVADAETGQTIPGVNVVLVGENLGSATDVDGRYTIPDVPAGTYTLSASFVGYETAEAEITVAAGETLTQDVQLETGAVNLDEVVVTGYGTQRRADVTGSIGKVSSEEIQDVPVQSTQGLLQGRTAGVQVSTTSGNPGGGFEVNIRGEGSINAGDDPLYIVDGVQVSFSQGAELTDRSPLNAISPKDIESIEVLKDASAAAIYGAQAANGVVIITTKSGRIGETRVALSYEGGRRFQSRRFDLMNRDEWIDFQLDAFGEEGTRDILEDFGYERDTPFNELQDFNWQNWLFQPESHQRAGFTANGGSETTQFYLSGSWANTGGAVRGAVDYTQYNFRINLTQQFTSNLDVNINLTLNKEHDEGVCQDGFFINCPFYQAIGEEPPISFPYLEDGSYNPNTEQSSTTNPAITLNEQTRESDFTQIFGKIAPTYSITDWLTLRGNAGLDYSSVKENDYGTPTIAPASGGELSRRFGSLTNITANATLDARRAFADVHNVNVLLGTEYRREFEDDDENGFTGFNNRLVRVPDAATESDFFQGFNTEFRILSYFGRLNYNYDDRYVVAVTGRFDGTSRFGADRRWGFFPSGSLAWRVSEEDFFTVDAVDELKLRISYGVVGNSSIGNFASRGLYNVAGSYDGQVGFRPSQLVNPILTWEESRSSNVGVDWSLWRGRLSGSLDVYRKVNDNLLLDRPLPEDSGYDEFTENVGAVRNQGIELGFQTINVQTEDFRWSTRFNVAVNQNEVLSLREGLDELDSGDALPIAVGHSLEAWKVPIWAGVNPADGRPMWYDADGNLTYRPDEADDQFFDGGEEDVEGGFGTRLGYKGLSLDLFFNFSYGATGLPNTQRTWTAAFGEGVLGALVDERWREPGDIAEYPRSTAFGNFDSADSPSGLTSRWLYSANYIRLRNATLSYILPSRLTDVVRLRGARVYVTGINLITWTSYLGIDPELAEAFESSSYPAEQQVNIGIEVDL